ncbi:MAG: NUDIX hydrolase [Rhodobacteraceae bacterium]|nr:MAG: NUDIX hydrolase [Paracoccaceae bacterium]
MTKPIRTTWREVLRPLYQRPRELQVAALCYRGSGAGRRVLLITSRRTKRWILPKGWLIDGLDAPGSAAREAWEEAGVTPTGRTPRAVGSFEYMKRLRHGLEIPVETRVFRIKVGDLADRFPEAGERRRTWVDPDTAAGMVAEPGLREILRAL